MLARREFLRAIGQSAGAGAMLKTMAAMGIASSLAACGSSAAANGGGNPAPRPPVSGRPASPRPGDWPGNAGAGKSVIVLGAGIAGMTTALEMRKLGYSCTLLEAQARAGGRNRTVRSGDIVVENGSSQQCLFDVGEHLYFNSGPSRIAHHHEFLLGYCRAFGVSLETFINDNRGAWLHHPGAFGGTPQLARRVRTDQRGRIAELLATAINQNALDAELTVEDRARVLQMLRSFGDLDASDRYTGSPRAGFVGQEETGSRQRGTTLSPLSLQELATDTLWEQRSSFAEDLEQQATMLQPVGGMDRIAEAFEAEVLDLIRYNAEVREIRATANGVRVMYTQLGSDVELEADYCVITIPAPVLATIANDFSAAHRDEIASFQYSSAVRVAFQSRRFWEQDHNIYGGISWTQQAITQVWYPNHGFGEQQGIVLGAYIFGGAAGDAFSADSPAARAATAHQEAANLHPQFATEATRGISTAWKNVPYQLGAWGMSAPDVLLSPDRNFFFAGEHLSILQGWQEGAILSAYEAIDAVVARDLA